MKTTPNKTILRSMGMVLALLGGSLTSVQGATQPRIDAAWQEAVALAAVPAAALACPEVVFEEGTTGRSGHRVAEYVPYVNEVHVYQSGRVPVQRVLVHEFLHAIFHQTQAGSLSLSELVQADPSEPWVQEKMAQARSL